MPSNDALSPDQEKRARRIFKLWAGLQGDPTVLTVEDSVEWGKQACKAYGSEWDEDKEEAWKKAFETYTSGKAKTEDEFVRCINSLSTMKNGLSLLTRMNRKLFDAIDNSPDGVVTFKEYYAYLKPIGLPKRSCKYGFHKMDLDNSGDLDRAEVAGGIAKYYLEPDENTPYRHFFGRYEINAMDERIGDKDTINELDTILFNGLLCWNCSLLFKDCLGCSGECELCCAQQACCMKSGTKHYGAGCKCDYKEEDPSDARCFMCNVFCVQCGCKKPETAIAQQLQLCCFVESCAFPCTDEVPTTLAFMGLQCLPAFGCCSTFRTLLGREPIEATPLVTDQGPA